MKIQFDIQNTTQSRIAELDLDKIEFGKTFTDHMVEIVYKEGQWQTPRLMPFQNISFKPSLSSLHYGQSVFEGMKAYCCEDGRVHIFRIEKHARRFAKSCERMCMPTLPEELFAEAVTQFVSQDRKWVPCKKGYSLYIRPFMFATDEYLGLRASTSYLFMVIASPVGAYYQKPVSLFSSRGEYVRAVKGGVGEAKTCGNYAASLLPAQKAQAMGCDQVLWLDGVEGKYIDEVGTMNIFFVIDGTLVTPPLYGAVLDGVTRDSVMCLARDWGIPVKEQRLSMEDLFAASKAGTLTEAFGTGTAAVISSVGRIVHGDQELLLPQSKGPLAQRFYEEMAGIQYGLIEDRHNWNTVV